MEQRIPIIGADRTFYAYRRSDVELTKDDRPKGMTYRPDPLPQGGWIGGPPKVVPTHMIIKGLSEDWQISPWRLDPSKVEGNPNHAVWECLCRYLRGTVITTAPLKYESRRLTPIGF